MHKIKAPDPVSDADALKSICTEKELHVGRGKYAQSKLRECKVPNVAATAFDVQQALPTSKFFGGCNTTSASYGATTLEYTTFRLDRPVCIFGMRLGAREDLVKLPAV